MKVKFLIILILFAVAACGRNRRIGLSDKALFDQPSDIAQQQSEPELDFSNMETYIVPQGIKYKESRAADPANPPVVIDLANRNLSIKKFDLNDYYSNVRYIKIKHPKSSAEGRFLLQAANYGVSYDENSRGFNFSSAPSMFEFTDDYIVAGDAFWGIHCYDKQGPFLYTIEANDFSKNYNVSRNTISFSERDFKGYYGGLFTTIGNSCLYNIREDNINKLCLYDLARKKRIMTKPFNESVYLLEGQSMARYVYHPAREMEDFLFTFDLKGDTLCRFPSYHPVPEIRERSLSPPSASIYYHNNQLTVRQSLNDTVYRVISPNRLVPAYVLNFGKYKVDIKTALTDEQSEKLYPSTWRETDRYILFVYTQNRYTPNNIRDGKVKYFYSYYDKNSWQLHHFSEGSATLEGMFLIANSIPGALPFILSHADMAGNQLRACYNKRRLEDIINNAAFTSLPQGQQNKLKTMQNELEDDEILIMILE